MDEQQAIQALKHGDIDGLEVLVACYQVKAIRTAYLITADSHLAQDVVQDVFLQIYRGIGSFDTQRPFGPWFMRSVVHAALKATKKTMGRVSVDDATVQDWLIGQESLEGQIETVETQQKIWEALLELSPRQRAVIVQRYFLEMSEKEMAEELKTAPGTVKWLLNAARERLRSLLGPERSAR